MDADSFINACADVLAPFQVFRCKPAAHIVALQVSIQAFGEGLVFAGIADKAGVVLNRLVHERVHILDEAIGCTSSTKELFWNMASRQKDGIDAQVRWSIMPYRFKSFYLSQVKFSKSSPNYSSITEVGTTKVYTDEFENAEFGSGEFSTAGIENDESGTAKVCTPEVCTPEIGSDEYGALVREAIASLFEAGIDPIVVIRWKDIFERLEDAIDSTETAANILEGIVIKNT